jgi:hypothetical protein
MIVDKNVPVQKGWHRAKKFDDLYRTIHAMDLGDSVFFDDYKEAIRFRGRVSNYRRTEPDFVKDFVIRKLTDGWRVWRTK